jgi:hypothetical protein
MFTGMLVAMVTALAMETSGGVGGEAAESQEGPAGRLSV